MHTNGSRSPQIISSRPPRPSAWSAGRAAARSRSIVGAIGLSTLLLVGVACSTDDAANKALKDAGVEGNVATGGELPSGFPKDDVATPDLELETGIALEGTYTLRYTSKDPATDVAAYKADLAENGFTVGTEFDHLADPAAGGNVGFTATSAEFSVTVSAFSPDAPGGGNYLAVVVMPA